MTTDDHQVSTDDHKVSTDEKVKSGGEDINWDNVGFGLTPTDFMFLMKCPVGDKYSERHLVPYGNLEISPSSSVLNYGQVITNSSTFPNSLLTTVRSVLIYIMNISFGRS